ncbi:NADH dehydrogenase [ubiquinone] 1 alpha subcomplex subunit 2 [Sebastes fasciatus]|uniref:NADH dehydrogenase [ubiquinone] 1 alpha subcomplex subunit 2 n=1 Tax=Sebastes fasciatus TaxID=394691 RepID=UPI003D9F711A
MMAAAARGLVGRTLRGLGGLQGGLQGGLGSVVVRGLHGGGLGKSLREIRVHLCQNSAASQGARDFVEQHYVTLKRSNPDFPILIRECSGVQARVWARYDLGKERSVSVDNMSADQVAGALQTLVQSKP